MLYHHVCVCVCCGWGWVECTFTNHAEKEHSLLKLQTREREKVGESVRKRERASESINLSIIAQATFVHTHTHAHRQKVVQAVAWFVIMSGWEIGLCKRERGKIFHNLLSIGVLSGLLGRGWCWWWSRQWIFKHQYSGKWQQRLDRVGPLSWEEWAGVLCLCWMTNCDNKWSNIKKPGFC